jgi:pimeloyl-ACP methyl ester carboxylesterase
MTRAKEHQVRVGGLGLQVREAGDGPPLLLLNGIGAHVGMWKPLEATLPDVRVISYDAPGTGRSQTPLWPPTIEGLAGLAEELLDHLGHDQVDVLGYSFGGIVAQHLARRAPERVRRLVLAATTPGWGGVAGSLLTMTHMSTPLRYYSRTYYDHTIGDIAGGRARRDAEWLDRHAEERQAHPPSPLGYAWQLAALSVPPGSLPWLHTLEHPTLVLAGDDDPILPVANALLLAHRIPRARLLLAPGEGHLLLLDPDSVAHPAIRDFVRCEDLRGSEACARTVEVDAEMVEAALREERGALPHPIAMLNSMTRALYGRAPVATAVGW